jgi:serine/threonine protein kinase
MKNASKRKEVAQSLLNTIIDARYQIIDEINNGSFADVYRVKNIKTKERYAMKIVQIKFQIKQIIYSKKMVRCMIKNWKS